MFRVAADARPADWVVARLGGFAESVLSLVPGGFPEYVRVLHPAYRRHGWQRSTVTWGEIARANGTRMHGNVQIGSITGSERHETHGQPGIFDEPPLTGALPSACLSLLAERLARHTSIADACHFAVWEGFAGLPSSVTKAPIFSVPQRTYHLLAGPLQAVHKVAASMGSNKSPQLWWPEDHAWCVATEIDLKSTYIGAGRACAQQLTSSPDLEAYTVSPESGIDWLSDALNPRPASA
jgi:hypothetical protein